MSTIFTLLVSTMIGVSLVRTVSGAMIDLVIFFSLPWLWASYSRVHPTMTLSKRGSAPLMPILSLLYLGKLTSTSPLPLMSPTASLMTQVSWTKSFPDTGVAAGGRANIEVWTAAHTCLHISLRVSDMCGQMLPYDMKLITELRMKAVKLENNSIWYCIR